ncbi:MtnX-like HAD-IB family phosphatase [soil metagenome]
MRIFCDFDGTISRRDTTDYVLARLADPAWRDIEARWEAGEICAADCMRRQIALIRGSDADLDTVLDEVEIDPDFAAFVTWAETNDFVVTIVSDGVDYFINRLLSRAGLSHLKVVSNLLGGEPGRRELHQPWMRHGCAGVSGVCKCEIARPQAFRNDPIVFVGDGRSDFCVSGRVDVLFAKDRLAEYSAARARAFYPFETFADVTATLAGLVAAPVEQALAV